MTLERLKSTRHIHTARGPLGHAMYRGDFAFAAGYVSGRFETDVSDSDVAGWVRKNMKGGAVGPLTDCWSDGTWLMWFRNRLGAWKVGCDSPEIRLSCEMHFFLLGCEETPEMLARLANERSATEPRVARSKVSRTTLAEISPIDAVASKVVHELEFA